MPRVALKTSSDFIAAISNAPVFFDSYTTQQFYLDKKEIILSSGNNGLTPVMVPGSMKIGAYKENVKRQFNKTVGQSKTNYVYKTMAAPDGDYLKPAAYDRNTYISQVNKGDMQDGQYQRGGSWTLYGMLFQ